jgi:hypothetical protein
MIIFEPNLTTFKSNIIFEAPGAAVKMGSSLNIVKIDSSLLQSVSVATGNTEQGKCRMTYEYPFFLF